MSQTINIKETLQALNIEANNSGAASSLAAGGVNNFSLCSMPLSEKNSQKPMKRSKFERALVPGSTTRIRPPFRQIASLSFAAERPALTLFIPT